MNVSAGKREFNIFDLFLHDKSPDAMIPFNSCELVKWMNDEAEKLYPQRFVNFECSDILCSSWKVWFHPELHRADDSDPYPNKRVYDERTFRNSIPAELDEVLLALNKADIVL